MNTGRRAYNNNNHHCYRGERKKNLIKERGIVIEFLMILNMYI
jgi:hypothetical protein